VHFVREWVAGLAWRTTAPYPRRGGRYGLEYRCTSHNAKLTAKPSKILVPTVARITGRAPRVFTMRGHLVRTAELSSTWARKLKIMQEDPGAIQ
jgi:hypothetical protein